MLGKLIKLDTTKEVKVLGRIAPGVPENYRLLATNRVIEAAERFSSKIKEQLDDKARDYAREFNSLYTKRRAIFQNLRVIPFYYNNKDKISYTLMNLKTLKQRKIDIKWVEQSCPETAQLLLDIQRLERKIKRVTKEWTKFEKMRREKKLA